MRKFANLRSLYVREVKAKKPQEAFGMVDMDRTKLALPRFKNPDGSEFKPPPGPLHIKQVSTSSKDVTSVRTDRGRLARKVSHVWISKISIENGSLSHSIPTCDHLDLFECCDIF